MRKMGQAERNDIARPGQQNFFPYRCGTDNVACRPGPQRIDMTPLSIGGTNGIGRRQGNIKLFSHPPIHLRVAEQKIEISLEHVPHDQMLIGR